MIIIDFFSLTGAWVDSCESWQIDTVLQVLYGAAADVAGDAFGAFGTWLMSV